MAVRFMRWSSALAGGLILAFLSLAFANVPETATFLVHKKKYIMGTVFEIAAYDASPEHASEAIDKAFEEVVRLDGVMSNYKPESDLSRLNRNGHFHPQTVSPDLYEAIRESLRYSRLSDGQFDITVAPLVDLWKAALRGDRVPSAEEQERLRDCVGYQKIQLLPPDRVKFDSSCMRIDLGSIGKGYAVDRAADILRSSGIKSALINAGESTIYGMGAPPGKEAWLVHLRDPSNKVDPQVLLYDNSVSTSEQTPPSLLGNDTAGHIIDPQTGRPFETACALSIVAKTGTASDALSTTLLLVGPGRGKSIVTSMADAAAIWVSPEGQTEIVSSGPQIFLGMGRRKEVAERSSGRTSCSVN
jgi:thiamine biosynthesis lipoprotein